MKAKDRKAFESMIKRRFKFADSDFERHQDEGYVMSWLEGAWTGWCMRARVESQANRGAKQ